MDFELPVLRAEEVITLKLRALYEKEGYGLYRMGSFEEYDLYMQNKPFLKAEDIITFTSADGRLMALKPDVTLSIVKNTKVDEARRVYYNENVFRRSRQTGEYRELRQMGLEYIGRVDAAAETEVLRLAALSLGVIGNGILDLSHMDLIEAVLAPFEGGAPRQAALEALRNKSPHGMLEAAQQAGLGCGEVLAGFCGVSGAFDVAAAQLKELASKLPAIQKPLDELVGLYQGLKDVAPGVQLRLDLSIVNDVEYYNGLIFQGYVGGIPRPVLSGGRYDNLLHRFGHTQGATGFALYLDAIGRAEKPGESAQNGEAQWLNVALPKGRLGNKVYKLMEKAGLACRGVLEESRKLVFEDSDSRVRYFLVKPSDVDIYVEHGAADIGVVGKDVLLESGADVLELLDLQLGKCRLAVAGRPGFKENPVKPLRVATKYPGVARRYYATRSRSVEVIKLHGSIELAPILGLSDVIVDIVETGSTLVENNLAVLADIVPSSARLIANRAAWRFKEREIRQLTERLRELI